jgi:hypothetical protein
LIRRRAVLFICISVLYGLTASAGIGQSRNLSAVLSSPVDKATVVSFFYFGDIWSHWRKPMNFYVADSNDPKLHTVLIGEGQDSQGWEAWITTSEMRCLTEKLIQSDLQWSESTEVKPFGSWRERPANDWLEITVISSKGTAKAEIRLTRMCDELQQLDSVMATPRILWQFQTLRWDDGCVIPGYHNENRPKN